MKEKSLIIKLICSAVSLCLSFAIIIIITYSWFISNAGVNAGIEVSVQSGSDYQITLEGWDESSLKWVDIADLSFDRMRPGEYYYMRAVANSRASSDGTLTAAYESYDSQMSNLVNVDIFAEPDDGIYGHITYSGVAIMDVIQNTDTTTATNYPYVVEIEDAIVYYINTSNEITIVDKYKIHNAMLSYNIESTTTDKTPDDLDVSGITGTTLSEQIFGSGATIYAGTTTYCYFALGYTDYETTPSADYVSNNYFIFQLLQIKKISLYA